MSVFTKDTLVDLLHARAQLTPDKIAFVFIEDLSHPEQTLTYAHLFEKACRQAITISQQVAVGERLLLAFKPGLELIISFFASLLAGVIAVPIYPPNNDKLIHKTLKIMTNCQAAAVIGNDYSQALFSHDSLTHIPQINASDDEAAATLWQRPAIDGDSIAFLQYTSGSTAEPKGVILDHSNLMDNLAHIYQSLGVNDETIFLGWLPPYHDMGLIGKILQPVYAGVKGVLMPPFSFLKNPLNWLQAIDRYQATLSGAPNFAFDYCVRRIKPHRIEGLNLSSWRVAFCGAEPVRAQTLEQFHEHFKHCGFDKKAFYPCYGLAESCLLVSGANYFEGHKVLCVENTTATHIKPVENGGHTLVSSGIVKEHTQVVNPDTQAACAELEVGEIWLTGRSVARGYWQNGEVNEQQFGQKLQGTPNVIYFKTGDLGFIHQQQLYVTGRMKDLIIHYGKNHYPHDIELSLYSQCGEIKQSCAFTNEDEELIIALETNPRNIEIEALNERAQHIAQTVFVHHQIPLAGLVFVATKSLPLTTSGKLRRAIIKQDYLQKRLSLVHEWTA